MDLNESGPFLRHLLGEINLAGALPDTAGLLLKSQRSLMRMSKSSDR